MPVGALGLLTEYTGERAVVGQRRGPYRIVLSEWLSTLQIVTPQWQKVS